MRKISSSENKQVTLTNVMYVDQIGQPTPILDISDNWSIWTDPFPVVVQLDMDELRDKGREGIELSSDVTDFGDLFFRGFVDLVTDIWLGW